MAADAGTAAALMLGAGSLTALASITAGDLPPARVFIGTAVAGAVIIGLADWNPSIGAGLAGVVFLTALLTSGYSVANAVTKKVSS